MSRNQESYRNVRRNNYTQVSNSMVNDKLLSLEGKGLMAILLSNHQEAWDINMKEIIKRSKNGRDAHYRVVNELIEKGYFARIKILDAQTKKFDEIHYIFSDLKEDIVAELERMKKWGSENKKILNIEYETIKEKKKKENKEKTPLPENQDMGEIPLPENQDTDENPFTEMPDTEIPDTENQYINNTNVNNTNLNNTNKNLNPNHNTVDIYDILWNAQIPHDLKNRIKVMISQNEISLTSKQIIEIQDAYQYQIQRGWVDPNCGPLDISKINDIEFSNSISKMLSTVNDIRNMRGLIQEWVEQAFFYKTERVSGNSSEVEEDLFTNDNEPIPFIG